MLASWSKSHSESPRRPSPDRKWPKPSDPPKRAANRVTKKIAAALEGKSANEKQPKSALRRCSGAEADSELIRILGQRLAEDGPNAVCLRVAISETIGQERPEDRQRASVK
jgi:hypothetical protein